MRRQMVAIAIAVGLGLGTSSAAAAGAFGTGPTSSPAGRSTGTALETPGRITSPDPSAPVLLAGSYAGRHPSEIDVSADAGNIITDLHWVSWTPTSAVGRGTSDLDSCSPSCAAAPLVPVPTTVTLSKPVAGHFTVMVEVRDGTTQRLSYPSSWPGGASASTAPGMASQRPAVEFDCASATGTSSVAVEPTAIVIACADDGIGAENLSWSHWGTTTATGTGVIWMHVCTPDCASSTVVERYHATVTLHRVVQTSEGPVFSVMSVVYTGTGPRRSPGGPLISRFALAYPGV